MAMDQEGALEVLAEIARDREAPATGRVSAARSILAFATADDQTQDERRAGREAARRLLSQLGSNGD
jgi:hypothetical protein